MKRGKDMLPKYVSGLLAIRPARIILNFGIRKRPNWERKEKKRTTNAYRALLERDGRGLALEGLHIEFLCSLIRKIVNSGMNMNPLVNASFSWRRPRDLANIVATIRINGHRAEDWSLFLFWLPSPLPSVSSPSIITRRAAAAPIKTCEKKWCTQRESLIQSILNWIGLRSDLK